MQNGLLIVIGLISIIVCIFLIGKQQVRSEKFQTSSYDVGAQTASQLFLTTPPKKVTEEEMIPISKFKQQLNKDGVFFMSPPAKAGDISNAMPADLKMSVSKQFLEPAKSTFKERSMMKGISGSDLSSGVIADPTGVSPIDETTFMRLYTSDKDVNIRERFADSVTYRVQQDLAIPNMAISDNQLFASVKPKEIRNKLTSDNDVDIRLSVAAPGKRQLKVYKCSANNVCDEITCPPNVKSCTPTSSTMVNMQHVSSALRNNEAPSYIKFDVI